MSAKPTPRSTKKPDTPAASRPSPAKTAKIAPARKNNASTIAPSPTGAGDRTADFEDMLRGTSNSQRYELRLYVTGTSQRSGQAIANVRSLCEEYLPGRYDLEVIDIYQQPGVAASEQIIAAPTLIKKFPAPSKRLVGDLSNRDKILVGLNLVARSTDTRWVEL